MIFIMRLSAIQIKEESNNNCIRINTLFYFTATVSTTLYPLRKQISCVIPV